MAATIRPHAAADRAAMATVDNRALREAAAAQGLRHFTVKAAHQSNRFLARRGWQVDRFERMPADGEVYDIFHMSWTLA